MTPEEQLIQRYFRAFNRHDLEAVMECFHDSPALVDAAGRRTEGRDAVRAAYQESFRRFPDGRCDLRTCAGNEGRAVAESRFHGTSASDGHPVEGFGAEVVELVGGKIKEIRDYHRIRSKAETSTRAA